LLPLIWVTVEMGPLRSDRRQRASFHETVPLASGAVCLRQAPRVDQQIGETATVTVLSGKKESYQLDGDIIGDASQLASSPER
jgi:hypothetical protein